MRIKNNPIGDNNSLYNNDDNSCALLAISYCFKVKYEVVLELFKAVGRKKNDGSTFIECRKVIKILSLLQNKNAIYIPNKNGISLKTFTVRIKKGNYLINHRGHMSFYRNGVFIDRYMLGDEYYLTNNPTPESLEILGFWKIDKILLSKNYPDYTTFI